MGLSADVAIGVAERVERTAGSAAGLGVFKRLALTSEGALRRRAVLGGLRCAIAGRDLGALRELCEVWTTSGGSSEPDVFATMKQMWRSGLGVAATDLAYAEVRRGGSARASYAYARCLDVAGDGRAASAFADAIAAAEREGAGGIARAARVRRVVWLSRSLEATASAIEEARALAPSELSGEERFVVAGVLLRAPSRFVRATALGLLDDLSVGEDRDLAARAVVRAASFFDEAGGRLSSLELDRLVALLGRAPHVKETARARAVVDALTRGVAGKDDEDAARVIEAAARGDAELEGLHRRARDVLSGRFEPRSFASSAITTRAASSDQTSPYAGWACVLEGAVGLRDGVAASASASLRELAERVERGAKVPAVTWSLATVALGAADVETRSVAGRLAAALLGRATTAPPRGFVALARALAACGMSDVAVRARRAAVLAHEPAAEDELARALTRSAWELARAGDRDRALSRLREAKALSTRSSSSER